MSRVPAGGTILVTGCTGFVGCTLTELLSTNGYQVIGVSNQADPPERIRPFLQRYLSADLSQGWPEMNAPDGVVHLAGLAAVAPSFDHPQHYITLNSAIVTNLGEFLVAQGSAARTVVVSSGAVYGSGPGVASINESHPFDFTSPYVVSKAATEHQAAYYRRRGLDAVIARPFNHIGPGQALGFIVPDLTDRLRTLSPGTPMSVGNLDARRDYTDVRDVARAYLALLELDSPTHEVYNVASGVSRSGWDVLASIADALGVPVPETRTTTDRVVDPAAVVGDASRLAQATGWIPEFDFETSVADFVHSKR